MTHPFEPVCGDRAHTLILGTFPSVRSRAEGFYYGHPRNRFWAVLAAVYGVPVPDVIETETLSVPASFAIVGASKAGGSAAGTLTEPYEKNAAFATVA